MLENKTAYPLTMTIYQIKDWDSFYENDRSRTRDKCRFVCVPNKQHGMGWTLIVSQQDGASIYGIFLMILGACSQQSLPRHGWLTDDGKASGRPWTPEDLALRFRRTVEEVKRALDFLCSSKVAWITTKEVVDNHVDNNTRHIQVTSESPSSHRPVTVQSPRIEGNRREEKGREGKGVEGGSRFAPPDILEAQIYGMEIELPSSEVDKFLDFYQSKNWKVGKSPMKDWKAAMRNWKRNSNNFSNNENSRNTAMGIGPDEEARRTKVSAEIIKRKNHQAALRLETARSSPKNPGA